MKQKKKQKQKKCPVIFTNNFTTLVAMEICKLLAAGADVNAHIYSNRPLIFAAVYGHVDVILFLLDNGANLDTMHFLLGCTF